MACAFWPKGPSRFFFSKQVSADDLDGSMNNQITYSIVEGNPLGHFAIQPKNGQISIAKHLDREEVSSGK